MFKILRSEREEKETRKLHLMYIKDTYAKRSFVYVKSHLTNFFLTECQLLLLAVFYLLCANLFIKSKNCLRNWGIRIDI